MHVPCSNWARVKLSHPLSNSFCLPMLGRTATQALKALLELAQEPSQWRSVSDLAAAQALPEPYLEQLLLRLRRAGVLEARRGRQGGYRLACRPADLSLARVLLAVGAWSGVPVPEVLGSGPGALPQTPVAGAPDPATEHVAALLQQCLARAIERELERLTLEELLFDLHSARACLVEGGGLMLG
jgi:Rrf2 family iron-sulfur cluster assembly transcriptional regulator